MMSPLAIVSFHVDVVICCVLLLLILIVFAGWLLGFVFIFLMSSYLPLSFDDFFFLFCIFFVLIIFLFLQIV